MSNRSLIGTWRLLSFESRKNDGSVTYPWGRDTAGLFVFGADGYASVAIMNGNRRKYASNDMLSGSPEEKQQAAEGYISYAGPYEVIDDRKVSIHCEVSFYPNWVGSRQERFYAFESDNNRLTLSTPPIKIQSAELVSYLIWERVGETG